MKKNFIPEGNPVLNILGVDLSPSESVAKLQKTEKIEKIERAEKKISPKKAVNTPVLDENDVDLESKKAEARSKRLNLLIRPSDFKEISRIAEKHSLSVNELINRLVESCIKNDKN